jgi:hypothetical protein
MASDVRVDGEQKKYVRVNTLRTWRPMTTGYRILG